MRARQLISLGVVIAACSWLGVTFLAAAKDSHERTRQNACRALEPDPVPAALAGRDAPDFELTDAAGTKWSLAKLRGRPVLLNFWATWCPPCVEEMPGMEDMAHRLGDRAVVLAVSVDESWDLVRKFFVGGTRLSVLLDTEKQTPKVYGTEKYPESFLIDASGRVRHHFINKRDWSKPEAALCVESAR